MEQTSTCTASPMERIEYRGNALVIDLAWSFGDDLDLAAYCVAPGSEPGHVVYFDNRGKRTVAPHVHLAHMSDGDGRSKTRREHLILTNVSANEAVFIFVWDHDAVLAGKPASFMMNPDSYDLTVRDKRNRRTRLLASEPEEGNCMLYAAIDESGIHRTQVTDQLDGFDGLAQALIGMAQVSGWSDL